MPESVLIVEDEKNIRDALVEALTRGGHAPVAAEGIAAAEQRLEDGERFGLILLDVRLRDGNGLEWLPKVLSTLAPSVPVIMATAYGDSQHTIEAMRLGAYDYVTKPFDLPVLLGKVKQALRAGRIAAGDGGISVDQRSAPQGLVGQSEAMLPVWKAIGRAAASQAPVLLTGETGTGKERVARAIHDHSARAAGPFVAVNLAGLASNLVESELFGHERGAFTNAMSERVGRLEAAAGGTLFLDEIGDLDPSLQTKLLRVLQEGSFERVGSNAARRCDFRVIAATHRTVKPNDDAPGSFRADLYYRLAVIELELPPLRARRSDIPLLVQHGLQDTQVRAVSEEAMRRLQSGPWPGNVRQLLHVVKRAAVMSGRDVIDAHDLPEFDGAEGAESLDAELLGSTLREAVASLERRMIIRALELSGGNRSDAARRLGIGRSQLYSKMSDYGISTKSD